MFKSLDSIASVVGIFMDLTILKFKQVLRSRKGLDYNTGGTYMYCTTIDDIEEYLHPVCRHFIMPTTKCCCNTGITVCGVVFTTG